MATTRTMDPSSSKGYHPSPCRTIGSDKDLDHSLDSTSASSSSGSQGIVETPDRGSHFTHPTSNKTSADSSTKRGLHCRQNFGKERGYIPPPNMNPHLRLAATPRTPVRTQPQEEPERARCDPVQVTPEERSADNEMPFDVLNSMIIRDRSTGTSQSYQRTPPDPPSPPATKKSVYEDPAPSSPTSTRGFESIWESSPEREQPKSRHREEPMNPLAPRDGRFVLRPPKFSDPSTLEEMDDDYDRGVKGMRDMVDRLGIIAAEAKTYSSKPNDYDEDYGLPPANNAATDTTREGHTTKEQGPAEIPLPENAPHDEDSLFDFEQEARNVVPQSPDTQHKPVNPTQKIRRRTRHTRKLDAEAEDDTSLEFSYGPNAGLPTNSHERAQQAWRSRREKISSLRSKQDPNRTKTANVSFGASDTVHHFEPHIEEEDDETKSLDERSINSEYTKTLESEVEDMIKDILFIGNGTSSQPGRRKIKHKHEVKRKMRKQQKERQFRDGVLSDPGDEGGIPASKYRENDKAGAGSSLTEEDTDCLSSDRTRDDSTRTRKSDEVVQAPRTSIGGNTNSKVKSKQAKKSSKENDANVKSKQSKKSSKENDVNGKSKQSKTSSKESDVDDPLLCVWDFVAGGIDAVTNVLGLGETSASENTAVKQATKKDRSSTHNGTATQSKGQSSEKISCTDEFVPFITGESCAGEIPPSEEPKPAIQDVIDYAQDFWYDATGDDSGSFDHSFSQNDSGSQVEEESQVGEAAFSEDTPFSFSRLDKDPRLAQLALHAARSLHQLQGVQYDDSVAIDMYTDVKISVVELKLPLGLIFLENDGGCFVTKVSPDGSAARSGGVELGDQLASINGNSSMKMKVDGICSLIARSPKRKCLELVFLRYVGPFKPSNDSVLLAEEDSFDLEAQGSDRESFDLAATTNVTIMPTKDAQGKKKSFRWFGRGKKKGSKGK